VARVLLRSLAILVFLSVAFTTSSLGAVSPGGSVFCIHRPPTTVSEIYLSPDANYAPLYRFKHPVGAYVCTDPVPRQHITHGVHIRLLRSGATKSEYWPAEAAVYDLDGVTVTRLAYVFPDRNQLFVIYTAEGVGYVVIDEEIPKSVADTFLPIRGDVAFLELDPVLRIYLRAEAGKIDVRHYSIDGVAEIPETTVRLDFAACSLSVSGFSVSTTSFSGKKYITGRFRILDGDGRPLFIPGLTVRIGEYVVSPQHSSSDMYYTFFAPYSGDVDRVVISADVSGCSHFEHEEEVRLGDSDGGWLFILVLLVGAAVIGFLRWRRK